MKYEGRIMFLTKQKAKEWKAGKWKHTYTNFYPNKDMLCCLSGDYVYFIKLNLPPSIILIHKVPKGYRSCLDGTKIIYKTPARLIKVEKRNLGVKDKDSIEVQCSFCSGDVEFNPIEPIDKFSRTKTGIKKLLKYLKVHNSHVIINRKSYYFEHGKEFAEKQLSLLEHSDKEVKKK